MIVFATRNQGKLRELAALIGEEVRSLADFGDVEVVEDADTFEGNADKKAAAALALSRMPSVGDDSGLEVEALNGAPGVLSARFAGEGHDDAANNRKLLEVMRGVENRRARFRCVLVYRAPGRRLVEVQGTAEHGTFDRPQLDAMCDLATVGVRQLVAFQRKAIEAARP